MLKMLPEILICLIILLGVWFLGKNVEFGLREVIGCIFAGIMFVASATIINNVAERE